MKPEDLLFAIDGVIGQCATAKTAYLSQGTTTVPIDSIFASLVTLRMVVEQAAEMMSATAETGECQHPADQVKRTTVGGGNWFMTCLACSEIIEQS